MQHVHILEKLNEKKLSLYHMQRIYPVKKIGLCAQLIGQSLVHSPIDIFLK